jgi:hypothetical protein
MIRVADLSVPGFDFSGALQAVSGDIGVWAISISHVT